jgi:hypothetical protein
VTVEQLADECAERYARHDVLLMLAKRFHSGRLGDDWRRFGGAAGRWVQRQEQAHASISMIATPRCIRSSTSSWTTTKICKRPSTGCGALDALFGRLGRRAGSSLGD